MKLVVDEEDGGTGGNEVVSGGSGVGNVSTLTQSLEKANIVDKEPKVEN